MSALSSLLVASPALANRAADGPIRAPYMLNSDHIAFTLVGGPWLQLVGDGARTPSYGSYFLNARRGSCSPAADVTGTAVRHRPVVAGRTVTIDATHVLAVTHAGGQGAVRWWTGTATGSLAAAVGVQRLPARLRSGGARYLRYNATIGDGATTADQAQCAALAATIVRRIVRTMRIATGPAISREPTGN